VHIIELIALELVEHVSQIEELGNLQNFGEEISGILPECENGRNWVRNVLTTTIRN
jgi:hypothetical protein